MVHSASSSPVPFLAKAFRDRPWRVLWLSGITLPDHSCGTAPDSHRLPHFQPQKGHLGRWLFGLERFYHRCVLTSSRACAGSRTPRACAALQPESRKRTRLTPVLETTILGTVSGNADDAGAAIGPPVGAPGTRSPQIEPDRLENIAISRSRDAFDTRMCRCPNSPRSSPGPVR